MWTFGQHSSIRWAETQVPGGGTPVYDVPDEPRTRYYDATSVEGDDHKYTWIKEWKINGHVLDWDSWEKTGQQWPINSD